MSLNLAHFPVGAPNIRSTSDLDSLALHAPRTQTSQKNLPFSMQERNCIRPRASMRLLSESVIKDHLASGGGFENINFVLRRMFLEMLQVLREIPGWRKEVVLVWEQCLHANKLV